MSKYAEDLKVIVGLDKLEARVKQIEEKAALTGSRGVAFQDGDGNIVAAAATGAAAKISTNGLLGAGYSAISGARGAISDAAEQADKDKSKTGGGAGQVADAGSTAGNIVGNAGAAIIGERDGFFDIGDLLNDNGSGGPAIGTDEIIKGISGIFSEKLNPLEIREDGLRLPGENLFSENDDLNIPDFYQGIRWVLYNEDGSSSFTPSMRAAIASDFARRFQRGSGYDAGDRYSYVGNISVNQSSPSVSWQGEQVLSAGVPVPSLGPFTTSTPGEFCTPGIDDDCPMTYTGSNGWLDGPTAKLYKGPNGTLSPHPRDILAVQQFPLQYNNEYGRSTILGTYFKGGEQKYFKRVPTNGGGFMYGEVSGLAGADIKYKDEAYVHIFDDLGRQKLVVKGSEAKNYVDINLSNI